MEIVWDGPGVEDGLDVEDAGVTVEEGESVETTSPLPFRSTPRCPAQHPGSLSQRKLPSEHLLTRGRNPEPFSCHRIGFDFSREPWREETHRSGTAESRARRSTGWMRTLAG